MMKAIVATRQLAPTALSRPWTDHLTLDLVCHILDRSVFHPFICFLVPLCLLATHRPAASPSVVYSFCWAWAVTLCHCLAIWNHRLAYGRARTVGLEDEVVLVAGGGGTGAGLGRLIAEVYAMKGARGVAVLDVTVPEQGATEREDWEDRGIRWFRCDVADVAQLEEVKVHIHAEVIDIILYILYLYFAHLLSHRFSFLPRFLSPNQTAFLSAKTLANQRR